MAQSAESRERDKARIDALIMAAKEKLALSKLIYATSDVPKNVFPLQVKLPEVKTVAQAQVNPTETWENDGGRIAKEREAVEFVKLEGLAKEIAQQQLPPSIEEEQSFAGRESAKVAVELNAEQKEALDLALSGKSFCLVGPAGTGKTTALRIIVSAMRDAGMICPLQESTKYLLAGLPGVAVISYTNKAVANIARGMPKDITCITGHKLVEFSPHFYSTVDADGFERVTMRFEPARDRYNPLPSSLCVISFEESGSISTELFGQIMDALGNRNTQFIFLGDLNQLPPIYGPAILGFKLLELPVVELKQVHRQAFDSPILRFAWRLLEGKPLLIKDIEEQFNEPGKFKIRPWKKRMETFDAAHVACLLMNQFIESGDYDPLNDMILVPYGINRSGDNYFCAKAINLSIAEKLGKMRNALVHEVIAGFIKHYYAIGDKILVRKQEAFIENIVRNGQYVGVEPLAPSTSLNRHGIYETSEAETERKSLTLEDVELMLAAQVNSTEIEEKKNQGSHILKCRFLDTGEECEVQTTGEYADALFAYALTIHKAQGSEWKRVILMLHHSHNKAICREMLYTAVTRARESLYIICEPEHFKVGAMRQRIRGNTLAEKAEFFKGKQKENTERLKAQLAKALTKDEEDFIGTTTEEEE